MEKVLDVMAAVNRLCGASVPLTVELFCGGVLCALLHIAQRLLATQSHASEKERLAEQLFSKGLTSVVEAFGVAVPQARAHPLVSASRARHLRSLVKAWQSLRCLSACRSLRSVG